MYNPFDGTMPPVEKPDDFIGRRNIYERLNEKIQNQQNIVMQGVKGSGKTSVLRTFFSSDYRIKMAEDENTIIVFDSYPVYLPCDRVLEFFSERIADALSILQYCGKEDIRKELKRKIREIRNDHSNTDACLRAIVELLHNEGYRVLLVLDDFEVFTSSTEVTVNHHNLLRSLMNKGLQFIVATNFDLTKDSLNGKIEGGSFLIQTFLGNEVLVSGFDKQETAEYLHRYLNADDGHEFSSYEVQSIYAISGGIPVLVRLTAKHAFDRKYTVNRELQTEDFDAVIPKVISDAGNLLESWYKYLTRAQYNTIQYLLERPGSDNDDSIMKKFYDRGVFKAYTELNKNGIECEIVGTYDFNSVILEEFSKDSEMLIQLMKRNEPLPVIKMMEYERLVDKISSRDSKWMERYAQSIHGSEELENQLKIIIDSCNLQKSELDTVKGLIADLAGQNSNKTGIVEKVKKGLTALSTGVTLATADYTKIVKTFDILMQILNNI